MSRIRQSIKQRRAKAKQASKLAEIRDALVSAGFDSAAKQAAILGVGRSTAWVLLNRDKRVGPTANVINRILASPNLPSDVRRKFEEYVDDKLYGRYGHSRGSIRAFRNRLQTRRKRSS